MKIRFFIGLLLIFVVVTSLVYAQGNERAKLIKNNLDKINLEEAPGVLRFLLGKPKINIEVNGDVYGFKIAGNRVKDFVEGGLDKPHYIIRLSEESVNEIVNSEDIMGKIEELYLNGEIIVEPQRVGAKIKFWFFNKLKGWFIPEGKDK